MNPTLADITLRALGPNVHEITVGPHALLFSYETFVGYKGPRGTYRLDKAFSKTTCRHLSSNGYADADTLNESKMAALLKSLTI